MRIVFIVGNYLPCCSATGACIKNLALYLQDEHEVTVICAKQSGALEAVSVIENHTVVRVETKLQRFRRISEGIRPEGHLSQAGRSLRLLAARWARWLKVSLPKGSCDGALTRAYLHALESLPSVPDLIVPTCLPFEGALAATHYKSAHPQTRLVPYLFDQFADSKTLNKPVLLGKAKRRANLKMEARLLEASDTILHVTWAQHVDENHPEWKRKLRRVEHPLLVKPNSHDAGSPGKEKEYMLYAGALDSLMRNPLYALRLLQAVIAESPSFDVRFFVPQSRTWEDLFSHCEGMPISVHEAVSSDEIGGLEAHASWLLSIGNCTNDQKPSKVYEYMAHGKPIVHIASRDDDVAARDLAKYPLACCLYQSSTFEDNVSKLKQFLSDTKGEQVDFNTVSHIFFEELPATIANALLAGRGGGVNDICRCVFPERVSELSDKAK